MLTCVMAPLDIGLHVFWGTTSKPSATSSTVFPEGRPISMVSSFVAVKYPGVCDHELPPVMSPVMQATGWRIVLTSVMTPLPVLLRALRCTTS